MKTAIEDNRISSKLIREMTGPKGLGINIKDVLYGFGEQTGETSDCLMRCLQFAVNYCDDVDSIETSKWMTYDKHINLENIFTD